MQEDFQFDPPPPTESCAQPAVPPVRKAGKPSSRTEQFHQANIRLLLDLWTLQLNLVESMLHFPRMVKDWIELQPRPKTVSIPATEKIDRGLDRITEAGLSRMSEIVAEVIDGRNAGFSIEPIIEERKDEVLRMCSLRVLAVREEGLGLWLISQLLARDKPDSAARLSKMVRAVCKARDGIATGPLLDETGAEIGTNEPFIFENARRVERLLTATERTSADAESWCRQALMEAIEMWCPSMGQGGSHVPLASVFANRLQYVARTCRTKECHSIQAPRRIHETRAKLRRAATDLAAQGLPCEDIDAAKKLIEEGFKIDVIRDALELPRVSNFSELNGTGSKDGGEDEGVETRIAAEGMDSAETVALNDSLERLDEYMKSLRPTEHLVVSALHGVNLGEAAARWVDATGDECLKDLAAATRNASRDPLFPRLGGIEVFRSTK